MSPLSDTGSEEKLDVSMSPLKDKQDISFFNGNSRCKKLNLDSNENLNVVLF